MTNPVQKRKRQSGKLDRKEWFFVSIVKSETTAAFIYEYARELVGSFPAAFDRIIQSNNYTTIWIRPPGRIDYAKLFRDHIPDFVHLSIGRFPDIPWQGLADKLRTTLVEAANKPYPDDHYLRDETTTVNEMTSFTSDLIWANQPFVDNEYFRHTPLGLQIKFNKPDSAIVAALAEWLPKERKRLGFPDIKFRPATGRGSYKDRLNGLGALRLVNRFANDTEKLAEYTRAKLKYDGVFQTVRALRGAAKKAEELLRILS